MLVGKFLNRMRLSWRLPKPPNHEETTHIPLLKFYRGRRVRDTKRCGGRIMVKVCDDLPGAQPQWLAVDPQDYDDNLVYAFLGSPVAESKPEQPQPAKDGNMNSPNTENNPALEIIQQQQITIDGG